MNCEMTMGDDGRTNGVARYWKCGKPAKFIIKRHDGDCPLPVCGVHAAGERKIAKRIGFRLPVPINEFNF